MAGGIDELIDVLYGMIEEAWSMPLGKDKCVIEREKALDILDELRGNLPGEIKAAREIVEKRNELIASGTKEADSVVRSAEEKARTLVDDNAISAQARARAKEVNAAAEAQTAELKKAAGAYCDDLLRRTEASIEASLADVRKIREQFSAANTAK